MRPQLPAAPSPVPSSGPDGSRLVKGGLAATLNHLLASEAWARETLLPYAGKVARFAAGPFALDFVVLDDGLLGSTSGATPADVTLKLPLHAMPALLASAAFGDDVQRESAALRHLRISGNAELAQAVGQLARHLRWDVEEDLSRVVGDIAAHRLVNTARNLRSGVLQSGQRLAASVAEFLTEEQATLVPAWRQRELTLELRTLRDDLDRLEQRVGRLKL
ncbi:SCP2 sterol-binding domain-containing protein [soil metagenome]